MYFIVCHPNGFDAAVPSRCTISKKGLLKYSAAQRTSSLKNHYKDNHNAELETLKKDLADGNTSGQGKQLSRNRKGTTPGTITSFFASSKPYKPTDSTQQAFLEDLVLYIAKAYRPISITENIWFRRLILRLAPCVVFPSRREITDKLIPSMVSEIQTEYLQPSLKECITGSVTFDLWMSRDTTDIFAMC